MKKCETVLARVRLGSYASLLALIPIGFGMVFFVLGMGGFAAGACAFCGMFGNLQEVQFGAIMLAVFLSSIYMFVAPFIHAWAVWRGKARSIWAMVFVFWVANWPLALLVPVMIWL